MKLLHPTNFEVKVPSTGKTVLMRPFVVKEYKALMIAKEGGDEKLAVNTALKNCIVEGDLDIMELPVCDAEYLFLQLYVSSTGESKIPVRYKCRNLVPSTIQDGDLIATTPKQCGTEIRAAIDISSAWVPDQKNNNKFKINDDLQVELRYPSLTEVETFDMATTKGMINVMANCIVSIFNDESIWTIDDLEQQGHSILDVIDMFPGSTLADIKEYFQDIPRVTTTLTLKCPNCGHEEVIVLRGLDDFFV